MSFQSFKSQWRAHPFTTAFAVLGLVISLLMISIGISSINYSHLLQRQLEQYAPPHATKLMVTFLKQITVISNEINGGLQPEFTNIDELTITNNRFYKITGYAGREVFIGNCRYANIDRNRVTKTDGTKGTIEANNLYESIYGYQLSKTNFTGTDTNPWDGGYEWNNKIMESQGLTIPTGIPVASNRRGAIGTMIYDSTNDILYVRDSRNNWKGVQLTLNKS